MPTTIAYLVTFSVVMGLVGLTTGWVVVGALLGALLGAGYAYLRKKRKIGLGPVWLLIVMALGGFLGPAIDADRHIGAIVCGIAYGWLGFLSDKFTLVLLAALPGLAIGGFLGGPVGCVVGPIATVCLSRLILVSDQNLGTSP